MLQAIIFTQIGKGLIAKGYGAAIAPNNGRTKRLVVFVDYYQTVHLVRNTDGGHLRGVKNKLIFEFVRGVYCFAPPVGGLLLGPARLVGYHAHFLVGGGGHGQGFARFNVQQGNFYRRAAEVVAEEIPHFFCFF